MIRHADSNIIGNMLFIRILLIALFSSLLASADACAGVMWDSSDAVTIQASGDSQAPIDSPQVDEFHQTFGSLSSPSSPTTSLAGPAVLDELIYEFPCELKTRARWRLENSKLPPSPTLLGLLKPS